MQHTPKKFLKDAPFYIFLMLVFVKPFISSITFPLINSIFWSLLYLDFCAMLVFDKKFTFLDKVVLNSPVLFFLALLLINQFFSINIYNSLTELAYFITYILIFLAVAQFSKEEKNKVILTIIISGCFISIYGLYQYFFGIRDTLKIISANPDFPNVSGYARDFLLFKRVFATFFSPDKLAAFLLYIIFLSLGISFLPNLKAGIKIFIAINLFISALALVLSKSAGGIITFIICLFVFLALMLHKRNQKDKTFLLVLSFILIIISVCAVLIIRIRLDETIKSYTIKNSITQRLDYWKASLGIIKDFPLGGIGLGNFKVLYTKYKSALSNETYYAHNSYLQILCETGFLGFIILLVLFLSFIKLLLINIKHNDVKNLGAGIFCAAMTFIVRNFFDYDLYLPELAFLWCICAGLAIPSATIKKSMQLNRLLFIPLIVSLLIFRLGSGISLESLKNSQYLLSNKRYEDSVKTLENAILFMPINDRIYNRLAKSYEFLANKDILYFDKAVNEYKRAISLNPFSAYNHSDLGRLFLKNDRIDEALVELEKAAELYPSNIEFYIYLQEAKAKKNPD